MIPHPDSLNVRWAVPRTAWRNEALQPLPELAAGPMRDMGDVVDITPPPPPDTKA